VFNPVPTEDEVAEVEHIPEGCILELPDAVVTETEDVQVAGEETGDVAEPRRVAVHGALLADTVRGARVVSIPRPAATPLPRRRRRRRREAVVLVIAEECPWRAHEYDRYQEKGVRHRGRRFDQYF